jgi:hypothetical protein
MRQLLIEKGLLVVLVTSVLSGCATTAPMQSSGTANYAYVSAAAAPGKTKPLDSLKIFRPDYSLIIVAIDSTPQPTNDIAPIYTIAPGKHSITIACSMQTFVNGVSMQGFSPEHFRTINFTAAPNGNYVIDYEFPSNSIDKDNLCGYAVLRSSPSTNVHF